MTAYEIRIIRQGGVPLVYSTSLLGDHAAVRRAQRLAQPGDYIEVWRGPTCVFTTVPERLLAH